MATSLAHLLEPYGAPAASIIELGAEPGDRHVPYLDLVVSTQRPTTDAGLTPHGVVERPDGPLAYVVDATRTRPAPESIGRLCSLLAFRGDAPYLTVVEPGRLKVYGITLRNRPLTAPRPLPVEATAHTFHRLHVLPPELPRRGKAIHKLIFDLLTAAVDGLVDLGVSQIDAISLTGRALFIRFLLDRSILTADDCQGVCPKAQEPEELFYDAGRTAATCDWLDRTFNGDFLQLSDNFNFQELKREVFPLLSAIMRRSEIGQLSFEWATLDFAYIPVGVLSQVYEWSAAKWDPSERHLQSMYFTPRRIATYMMREVFAGLAACGPVPPHKARVLDPAVGGGVFLVAAFHELVAAWWRQHRKPPNTVQIRSILNQQLTGFDVNEPALRLAALSLYLTAIELDQHPFPVERLGFSPLHGKVLHNVRPAEEPETSLTVGSLGTLPRTGHGCYDIVVGNPPWTSLTDRKDREGKKFRKGLAEKVHREIVAAVRPIVKEKLGEERCRHFEIPDRVPDIAFVWGAMAWARPGGWIAFALHARWLFKQSQMRCRSRNDLLNAMTVTGILNGTDLRETNVWPQMRAPFCLLFARNDPPDPDSAFFFVSPYRESNLNQQGRIRIDAKAAQPIVSKKIVETPTLLKTLFRGTALDVAVLAKIASQQLPKMKDLWESDPLLAEPGQGYRIAASDAQKSAAFLLNLPNLTAHDPLPRALIETEALGRFSLSRLHRPRNEGIYKAPLLLVRESPPADPDEPRCFACFEDLAFSVSFYGYSAHRHPQADFLIRYLTLLFNSNLFLWYCLMTSGKFGIEREAIEKLLIDEFPIVPLDRLDAKVRRRVTALSDDLFAGRDVRGAIDDWAAGVYGLDRWDGEVIRDSLSVGPLSSKTRRDAERPPKNAEIGSFARRVQQELEAFAGLGCLRVQRGAGIREAPWEILRIETAESVSVGQAVTPDLTAIFDHADALAASQIIMPDPEGGRLLVATLRQYRYWTQTRARLLALEVVEEYLDELLAAGN